MRISRDDAPGPAHVPTDGTDRAAVARLVVAVVLALGVLVAPHVGTTSAEFTGVDTSVATFTTSDDFAAVPAPEPVTP